MKHIHRLYLIVGTLVCVWLTTAAFAGWQAPHLGVFDGGSSGGGGGRSSWGFWGGGK